METTPSVMPAVVAMGGVGVGEGGGGDRVLFPSLHSRGSRDCTSSPSGRL